MASSMLSVSPWQRGFLCHSARSGVSLDARGIASRCLPEAPLIGLHFLRNALVSLARPRVGQVVGYVLVIVDNCLADIGCVAPNPRLRRS